MSKPPGCLTRLKRKVAGKAAKVARLAGNRKAERKLKKIADPLGALEEEKKKQAALKAEKESKQHRREGQADMDEEDHKDNVEMLGEREKAAADKGYLTHMEVGHEGNNLTARHRDRREKDTGRRWDPEKATGDLADFVDLLRESETALIYAWYFRELVADGLPPPCRQDLPAGTFMVISHWTQLLKLRIISVSHAWLTREHPDPKGLQVKEIVNEFATHWVSDGDVIFYDWCSMYQHDIPSLGQMNPGAMERLRTADEQKCFDRALKGMELFFSHHIVQVLVIADTRAALPYSMKINTDYWGRGWCYFELAVAHHFKKVLNAKSSTVDDMICNLCEDPNKMFLDLKEKKFRDPADRVQVTEMIGRVFEVGVEGELRAAADKGHLDRVIDLLDHGVDPKAADAYGRTALHRVAMVPTAPQDLLQTADPILGKRAGIAKALLAAHADPNAQAHSGHTPLEFARICGQVEVCAVLSSSRFVGRPGTR